MQYHMMMICSCFGHLFYKYIQHIELRYKERKY